jgi:hypothetical protein
MWKNVFESAEAKAAAAEQRARILTYKRVFSSVDGKVVFADLMDKFHLVNEHDGTPFPEGQRSVVLYVMRQTNINVEKFDEMWREGTNGIDSSGQ